MTRDLPVSPTPGQPLRTEDVGLLVKGDVLRVIEHGMTCADIGDIMILNDGSSGLVFCHKPGEPEFVWQRIPPHRFAFHNIVIHPICGVLWFIGATALADRLHGDQQ